MKDFTSKLSLYDILTQLISGFLILALFIPMPTNGGEIVTESYHWIFLLIFSYSIGIIYHRLLERIRSKKGKWFLLILPISLLLVLFCKKEIECKECTCYLIMTVIILAFLLILLIKQHVWFQTIFERNNEKAITKAYNKIYETDSKDCEKLKKDYENNTYYSIMEKPAYSTISILETQEAFLRNITWIVVAYLLCYYFSLFDEQKLFECIFILEPPSMLSSNCLILCVSLLLFLILILFARYQTQMKVYKAVWDAGKYLQNSSKQ
ncbi:MAG: hypothetical protein UIG52_03625 [Bacteroidales bacterium]|nr:hypothetical protein [Bacteroidales bacterium]MEE0937101.1 hypothetical protein [Bacteroidales bacterium]